MVDLLEQLLQLSGLPVVAGLLVLGGLPTALAGWIHTHWRGHQDAYFATRPARRALVRRYRGDHRTQRRILEARLCTEMRFDRNRWLVATALWAGLVICWGLLVLALLQRAWVRDQLDRDLAMLPGGLAWLLFACWSVGLVLTVRSALDRRARDTSPGVWPAAVRALPMVFVFAGIAAWLSDRVQYPLSVALMALLVPWLGMLALVLIQNRRLHVDHPAVPAWVATLAPELAASLPPALPPAVPPARTARRTLPEGHPVPRASSVRSGADGWDGRAAALAVGSALRSMVRRGVGAVQDRRRTAELPGAVDTVTRRWADLATPPEPLGSRDPRRLGPYTVVERIGSGGMALVYRGTSRSGQDVALKIPAHVSTAGADLQRRLSAEIRAMARLDVPGVVRIRDADADDGLMYIVMDFLRGPTLDAAVARLGPLHDGDQLRALAQRMARALAGIHRAGITHRDVKPKNVLLTDAGPVLVDLGIAKIADATQQLTATGAVVGSAGYVPPEVHRGECVGHDADVFAWGCCIGLAASGRPLFAGDTLHAVVANVLNHRLDRDVLEAVDRVDRDLGRVVRRAVDPDRARRPRDGGVLRRLLPPAGAWPAPILPASARRPSLV